MLSLIYPPILLAGVYQSFLRARDTPKKGGASLTGEQRVGIEWSQGPEKFELRPAGFAW